MRLLNKHDAIKYYSSCKNDKLRLFAEDISSAGNKQFYVSTPTDIFGMIKLSETSHFYEFWSDKSKLLFGLDIDMKIDTTNNKLNTTAIITNIINNVCDGSKKYYDYTYKIEDIIVLQNDEHIQKYENPNKISYHIIFRGLTFENHLVCKDFFMRLSTDYAMPYCDKSIYNLTCLRVCFCSKMGRNAILEPVAININGVSTQHINTKLIMTEEQLFDFWHSTLLTNINTNDKVISKKTVMPTSIEITKPINSNTINYDNLNIEDILFQLPSNYYNDYTYWINIGMILHRLQDDTHNYFDLWNNWSKQSDSYDASIMLSKWNSFAKPDSTNTLGIGTLIKWCKDEGIINVPLSNKNNIDETVSFYPEQPIIISPYFLNHADIIEHAKLTSDIIAPYLNYKLLAIQSEKGTGKTYNLLEALFANKTLITKDTSILFVSCRRTFGIKLLNDLQIHGFKLYSEVSEKYITANRIICQIDSLLRLERDLYDIVIVDECESLSRYLTSSHFTKNNKANCIVGALEEIISDASNVYIMDADLSDRCLNYFKNIKKIELSDIHLIINTFKAYSDYTIHYMTYNSWLNFIMEEIEDNKKLVIPMASNNKAKDLLIKINQDYPDKKVLLIHKETSDEEKILKILKVNETWINYDIVIYTPSVCMGVSFDVPDYFDNIYAYGCSDSLGSQEFCQMLHRVRNPINKCIYLALNQYTPYQDHNIISYETAEQILSSDYYLSQYDLYNNLVHARPSRKLTINTNVSRCRERVIVYPYKHEPIYDMFVRNSMEIIKDKLNFAAQLFGYIKHKSYQLNYIPPSPSDISLINDLKNIKQDRESSERSLEIEGIKNAITLTNDEYLNKIKQKDEYLDEEDRNAIKRYNMISCYKLQKELEEEYVIKLDTIKKVDDFFTDDFIDCFHNIDKLKWYRNLTNILATPEQDTQLKLSILKTNTILNKSFITNCYLDFTSKDKYAYHVYAIEIIKQLGFDINNMSITISYHTLDSAMATIMEWFDTHKFEIVSKYDIRLLNKNFIELLKFNERLKIVNSIIISQYGIRIKCSKQSTDLHKKLYKLDDNSNWIKDKCRITLKPVNIVDRTSIANKYKNFDSSTLDLMLDEQL